MPMIKNITSNLKKLMASTERDRVMVYAAQASYFVMISVVPLICLLISAISFFIPADIYTILDAYALPQEIKDIMITVIDQLFATQKVSLLSISALFALWTASRGSDAIRVGLENVYHEQPSKGFWRQQLKSLITTIIMIVLLIGNIAFALFGGVLFEALNLSQLWDVLVYCSAPILFVVMCGSFTIVYAFVGKGGKENLRDRILPHVPGAVFATVGWLVFSYGYALYIKFFPIASVIYGSLTAVCLIMLWLYICMTILLLGAEINKLIMRNKAQKLSEQSEVVK